MEAEVKEEGMEAEDSSRNFVVFCNNDTNTVSFQLKDLLLDSGGENDLLGETPGSNYTLIHIGETTRRRKRRKKRRSLDYSGGGSSTATTPSSSSSSSSGSDEDEGGGGEGRQERLGGDGADGRGDSSDDSGADSDGIPTVSVMVERIPSDYVIPVDGEIDASSGGASGGDGHVAPIDSPGRSDHVPTSASADGWEFSTVSSVEEHDENSLVSQFTEDEIGKLHSILRSEQAKEVLGHELPEVLGDELVRVINLDHCYTKRGDDDADGTAVVTSTSAAANSEDGDLDDDEDGFEDEDQASAQRRGRGEGGGREDGAGADGDDEGGEEDEDFDFKLSRNRALEAARRSERQKEKLQREEVERIRAQNQEMLEREKNLLKQGQQQKQTPQRKAEEVTASSSEDLSGTTQGRPAVGKYSEEESVKAYAVDVDDDVDVDADGDGEGAGAKAPPSGEPRRSRSMERRRVVVESSAKVAAAAPSSVTSSSSPLPVGTKKYRQTTLPFLPRARSSTSPTPSPASEMTPSQSDSDSERRRSSLRERKPTQKLQQSEEYLNLLANVVLDRRDAELARQKLKTSDGAVSAEVIESASKPSDQKSNQPSASGGGKKVVKASAGASSSEDAGDSADDGAVDGSGGPPNDDRGKRSKKNGDKEVREGDDVEEELEEDDDEEEGEDEEDDEVLGAGEEEDENDPNKLWCLCRKPHNNRFMICCDTCEDWFHGSCVGITKAMGKKIEQQMKQWMCPNCRKGPNNKSRRDSVTFPLPGVSSPVASPPPVPAPKTPAVSRSSKKSSAPGADAGTAGKSTPAAPSPAPAPVPVVTTPSVSTPSSSSSTTASAESKGSSGKAEIKKKGRSLKKSPAAAEEKPRPRRHCAFSGCGKFPSDQSRAYCDNRCIRKALDKYRLTFSKPPTTRISVIDKVSNKVLKGFEAPQLLELGPFLTSKPNYEIFTASPPIPSMASDAVASTPLPEKKPDVSCDEAKPTSSSADPSTHTKEEKDKPTSKKHSKNSYEYDPGWEPSSAKKEAGDDEVGDADDVEGASKRNRHRSRNSGKGNTTTHGPRKAVLLTELPPAPGSNAAPIQLIAPSQRLAEKKNLQHQKSLQAIEKTEASLAPEKVVIKLRHPTADKNNPSTPDAKTASAPNTKTPTSSDKAKLSGSDKVAPSSGSGGPAPVPPETPARGSQAASRADKKNSTPSSHHNSDKKNEKSHSSEKRSKSSHPAHGDRKNSSSSTHSSSTSNSASRKSSGDTKPRSKSARGRNESDPASPPSGKPKETGKNSHGSSSVKVPETKSAKADDDATKKQHEELRGVVKKVLTESLVSRGAGTSEGEEVKEKYVSVALAIECELWATHGTDVTKYKSKFRSLVFNIKDQKNDLHERLLSGEVEPSKVVHMNANELAPKELAEWRQQSEKHDIEMIKRQEFENMRSGEVFLVKTHKGEVIIEGEDGAPKKKVGKGR